MVTIGDSSTMYLCVSCVRTRTRQRRDVRDVLVRPVGGHDLVGNSTTTTTKRNGTRRIENSLFSLLLAHCNVDSVCVSADARLRHGPRARTLSERWTRNDTIGTSVCARLSRVLFVANQIVKAWSSSQDNRLVLYVHLSFNLTRSFFSYYRKTWISKRDRSVWCFRVLHTKC